MTPALVLLLAVIGVSFSGPLVRMSHADPLAIAAWRLGFSLLVIGGILLAQGSWRQWRRLSRADLRLALAAGVLLALHFWSWNTSIGYTTVAASVVLVNTHPVFVAIASVLWLHEPPTRRQWTGIAIAMAGALVVALPDLGGSGDAFHGHALLGDLLAVLGAVTVAGYFVIGRRLRVTLDLWPYVGLVYGACFVVLLALAGITGARLGGQPPRELAIFAALALGPMLLGHTGFNWALKHLPAYVVNVTLLGEPVGATLLAALLPGIREVPGAFTLLGGALILAGILATAQRTEARVAQG
ncbi:MAG: putative rane protein [Gemmatimonadetes bacterium]|nr:putative rane protein [Gemmatimonadota bacterium]